MSASGKQHVLKNVADMYALSPLQEGMLFHGLYARRPGVYVVQAVFRIEGVLQAGLFREAWQHVLDRHPALRTVFVWEGVRNPVQVVRERAALPWVDLDWRGFSAREQEEEFGALLREDRSRGFSLGRAPLMRCALVRSDEETYRFLHTSHHLIFDGWSAAIVFREAFVVYEALRCGAEPSLPARRPFCDYIGWLHGQDRDKAEAFWREALRGFDRSVPLGADRPAGGPGAEDVAPGQSTLRLSRRATEEVVRLAQQHHVTLNTLIQGVWALLLSRYGGQQDVVFGAAVAGRPVELDGVESMIGLFINTVPVRVDVVPSARLGPWLRQLRDRQADITEHAHSSLTDIHGWSDVPRGNPLFESILVFENYPADACLAEPASGLEVLLERTIEHTNYPLSLTVTPGDELRLVLKSNPARFDAGTVERMQGHLDTLLAAVIQMPDTTLAGLPMLTAEENRQLLVEWTDTAATYPRDKCLHELFEAQVARTPRQPAVVCGDRQLTYAEVDMHADRLATRLRRHAVGPDRPVPLCVDRSVDMLVGLFGILKAGAAYMPLDPRSPPRRLAAMLRDMSAPAVVTQQHLAEMVRGAAHRVSGKVQPDVICLDAGEANDAESIEPVAGPRVTSRNLAYIICTSGSAGLPNGVMIEHQSVVNLAFALRAAVGGDAGRTPLRVSLNGPLSFDTSVKQIVQLLFGHTLVIVPEALRYEPETLMAWLREQCIDVLDCTPSQLTMLAANGFLSPSAYRPHTILVGGEAIPPKLWKRLAQVHDARVFNLYGPTECTVDATVARVCGAHADPVIGRPIANVKPYLLDGQLLPVPVGVPAELCIGGDCLARGYFNRPELNAERFVPNPFDGNVGGRLHRTGDRVRYLADGTIEFLGRMDDQVKLRGHRIEPGEIEAALEAHPGVQRSVVNLYERGEGDKRLVAYLVPGDPGPSVGELRAHLAEQLPSHMVPSHFVVLDALPLTRNGKVDRRALPAPEVETGTGHDAPRNPMETMLCTIWADVLGLGRVGIHDNFFELGGHSLLAVRVVAQVRKTRAVDLSVRDIFERPTIAELSDMARCESSGRAPGAGPAMSRVSREERRLRVAPG